MQTFAVLLAIVAVASANVAVQYTVPVASSSATVVRNDRVGGNFAYSTQTVQGAHVPVAYNAYSAYNSVPVYGYANVAAVQPTVAVAQPVVKTVHQQVKAPAVTYTQSVPAYTYNNLYTTPVVGHQNQVVYSPYTSAYVAGTPAATYSAVAGVSPLSYGYNNYGYNSVYGYPYTYGAGYYGNYVLAKK